MPITNGKYVNPGWVNGQAPAINSAELNAISDTLQSLDAGGGSASVRSPFIVVGTSQNGATSETCDFLCDGTEDDVEINAAIDKSLQTGQEVYILGGDYIITNAISAPSGRSMTICGAGRYETKLLGNGTSVVVDSYQSSFRNISIGGYSSQSYPDILVDVTGWSAFENVNFLSFQQYGIYNADGGVNSEVYINNCSFQGSSSNYCIYIGSSNGTRISNCNIGGNVHISGSNSTIDNSSVQSFTFNQARSCSVSGCVFSSNLQLMGSSFCSVSNNIFLGSFAGSYGISLDTQSTYNVVTGNGGGRTNTPQEWAGVTDNGSNNYVANNMPT